MIKTITNTTFTLGIIAILNFLLITLVLRNLGTVGAADVGLIILGISLIIMINNVIGGSALVYFIPRESNFTLLTVSYLWAGVSTVVMGTIIYFLQLVPMEFVGLVILIGFLECLFSINNQYFIGKEDLKSHNAIKLFQKLIQLGIFVCIEISINNFVLSLLFSYLICLPFSFYRTFSLLDNIQLYQPKLLVNKMFKYGFQIQSSNIVQLLNYRLLYYIIEGTLGKSYLGLFSIAVQLSESLWIPSKALSIIQYGRVSNEKDESKKSILSLRFMKLSFIIAFVLTAILLLIPNSFLVYIFKEGILGVKPIILSLAVGILSIALSLSFSHYLSGKGMYHYLVKGSGIGLIVLLSTSYFLIKKYGLIGAGISTSLSYFASSLYLGRSFVKEAKYELKDFLITKRDFQGLRNLFMK